MFHVLLQSWQAKLATGWISWSSTEPTTPWRFHFPLRLSYKPSFGAVDEKLPLPSTNGSTFRTAKPMLFWLWGWNMLRPFWIWHFVGCGNVWNMCLNSFVLFPSWLRVIVPSDRCIHVFLFRQCMKRTWKNAFQLDEHGCGKLLRRTSVFWDSCWYSMTQIRYRRNLLVW